MFVQMCRYLTAFSFLSLSCSMSQSGIMTGADLLDICQPQSIDPVYRLKLSECTGYIIGVSDTFDCKNKALGFNWDSARFNNQQKLVAMVIEWMHFHPNYLHYQASGLVASALAGTYPCPLSVTGP